MRQKITVYKDENWTDFNTKIVLGIRLRTCNILTLIMNDCGEVTCV